MEELSAQVAIVRLLEERIHLRVVEANPIRSLPLAGREALDVGVGQSGELLARDLDPVAELVQVALEGDLHLDEAVAQPLELGALVGAELMAGPTEVSQPVLQQPSALALQRSCLVGLGEGANRVVQVGPEDDRHAPLVQELLGLIARVAHGGIDMDLAHEGAAAVGPDELSARQLEGQEGVIEGGGAGARHGAGDVLVGGPERRIGLGTDRVDRHAGVVVQHRGIVQAKEIRG